MALMTKLHLVFTMCRKLDK